MSPSADGNNDTAAQPYPFTLPQHSQGDVEQGVLRGSEQLPVFEQQEHRGQQQLQQDVGSKERNVPPRPPSLPLPFPPPLQLCEQESEQAPHPSQQSHGDPSEERQQPRGFHSIHVSAPQASSPHEGLLRGGGELGLSFSGITYQVPVTTSSSAFPSLSSVIVRTKDWAVAKIPAKGFLVKSKRQNDHHPGGTPPPTPCSAAVAENSNLDAQNSNLNIDIVTDGCEPPTCEMVPQDRAQGVLSRCAPDDPPPFLAAPHTAMQSKGHEGDVPLTHQKDGAHFPLLSLLSFPPSPPLNPPSPLPSSTSPARKTILSAVTAFAPAGCLTAIMGPSGCGKTTLLDVLAGRAVTASSASSAAAWLTGSIRLGGAAATAWQLQRSSAYVMQDDLMLASLTVRETLLFSAELRRPSEEGRIVKVRLVEELLDVLGLRRVADERIGEEGRRGVSGGRGSGWPSAWRC